MLRCGWSDAKIILYREDFGFPYGAKQVYSGYSHEVMSKDGGKKIYLVISTCVPYNVCIVEVEFN